MNQTPKDSCIKTKKALRKFLNKINFLSDSDNDDILLNTFLNLSPPSKILVNILIKKLFTLDIGLDKIVGKFSHKKLMAVKNLFSKINGFEKTFTFLKFAEIIRAMFTSKLSMVQASEKTKNAKIIVNINLKKSIGHLDWAVVLKKIPISISAETV
ncbi:hypothetical protein G9A89_021880 [Geosiphon pyriformis]|nr:hypothetical protein G9A89_021880 [Geosiphon pyriformis]